MSRFALTKAAQERAIEAARKGLPYKYQAALAGVSERAYRNYRAEGRKDWEEGKSSYLAAFYGRLEETRGQFFQDMMGVVYDQAMSKKPNSWLPAMTALERLDPENWGKRDHVSVEMEGPAISVNIFQDDGARQSYSDLIRRLGTAQDSGTGLPSGAGLSEQLSPRDADERLSLEPARPVSESENSGSGSGEVGGQEGADSGDATPPRQE